MVCTPSGAMKRQCRFCNDSLPVDGRFMKCSECEYGYHFGDCSGCSEATYKSKGESGRKAWRCSACRAPKANAAKGQAMDPDLSVFLGELTRKLDMLSSLPGQVEEVNASIQLMSQKYDEILSPPIAQEKEISSLKKKVSKTRGRCNPKRHSATQNLSKRP